jgi:hypothetical protein
MDFDMDSLKSMVGLDDGAGGGSSSSDSGGGGMVSQAWNAVSDGASQAWDAASSTASSAVSAVSDGASQAWDAASSTASSAVSAVGDGASNLMQTASDDASAAWSSVTGGVSDIYNKITAKPDDGPIVVPMSNSPVDGDGHSPEQAQWIKDHPEEVQKNLDAQQSAQAKADDDKFRSLHGGLSKDAWDKAGHEVGAKDAGFDNAQHMQDYSQARKDFEAKWDKLNKMSDSDEREKARQAMGVPKSMDDYMRQQHISPRGTPAY